MSAVPDSVTSAPAEAVRSVASHLLGPLTVDPSQCFRFPDGIAGFESLREFALIPTGREGFWWLQAVEDEGITFVVADPFRARPGYTVDLGGDDARLLQLETPEDALVLTVVTLPMRSGEPATTNLRGPLVFNTEARLGRQVVSAVEGYGVHEEIALPTG